VAPSGDVQRLTVKDVALGGEGRSNVSMTGNSASQKATQIYQKSKSLQSSTQK